MVLLRFGPNANVAAVDVNMNQVWTAAHGTIFYVFLTGASSQIYWNDDVFSATVTNVTCLLVHLSILFWD